MPRVNPITGKSDVPAEHQAVVESVVKPVVPQHRRVERPQFERRVEILAEKRFEFCISFRHGSSLIDPGDDCRGSIQLTGAPAPVKLTAARTGSGRTFRASDHGENQQQGGGVPTAANRHDVGLLR